MVFLYRSVDNMKTTFDKYLKTHAPVNGWMAICSRDSRLFGIVEMNLNF